MYEEMEAWKAYKAKKEKQKEINETVKEELKGRKEMDAQDAIKEQEYSWAHESENFEL